VDVSSLFVPKGSEIVSAKGRGFPGVTYKSRVDPILDPNTKLAVLINDSTASAAEIVSGAVQDLDVGIIVGSGRTFGKGLVQNVEELPFNTALKFTVAKYYTPSGRCIQATNYSSGAGLGSDGNYKASKVAEKDKNVFYTTNGREVKDGGGVLADYKVKAPKASALEVTLLRSSVIPDFAAEWSKKHELTNNFAVDDSLYREFQAFVMQQAKNDDLQLDALYSRPINDLKRALERSEYKGSTKELEQLQASIKQDMSKDFDKYKSDIKEDLAIGILSRYLPESMLINRSIQTDQQVLGALKILGNQNQFNKLLARSKESIVEDKTAMLAESKGIDSTAEKQGAKITMQF
jgi:carboxyl-terminal processing protease